MLLYYLNLVILILKLVLFVLFVYSFYVQRCELLWIWRYIMIYYYYYYFFSRDCVCDYLYVNKRVYLLTFVEQGLMDIQPRILL